MQDNFITDFESKSEKTSFEDSMTFSTQTFNLEESDQIIKKKSES